MSDPKSAAELLGKFITAKRDPARIVHRCTSVGTGDTIYIVQFVRNAPTGYVIGTDWRDWRLSTPEEIAAVVAKSLCV